MFHRKPSFAGSFYPDNKDLLYSQIDRFVKNGSIQNCGDIVAVVSPHAGYIYSGPVAGYSYSAVKGRGFDCALVLAPSHRARFDGFSVIDAGVYETPLGNVEIDSVIGKNLIGQDHGSFMKEIDLMEHSLEVQIPFLQYSLGSFTLAPVIIGTTDFSVCSIIADEIFASLKGITKKILIVISTDLSHYHPYGEACAIDGGFAESLASFDEKMLVDILKTNKAEACGEGALLVGMMLSKKMGATGTKIIHYANSGDVSGDKSRVVGYISAAFTR